MSNTYSSFVIHLDLWRRKSSLRLRDSLSPKIDMDGRLAIDSGVLLLYFVLIISIGLYMGRKEENLKDFALGGRRIPWWAVLASIIAAETSAKSFRFSSFRPM